MPRTKLYYTLLVRYPDTETWGIEFGSYVRSEVKFEMDDLHNGYQSIPRKNMVIVATDGNQKAILAKRDELQAKTNQEPHLKYRLK